MESEIQKNNRTPNTQSYLKRNKVHYYKNAPHTKYIQNYKV